MENVPELIALGRVAERILAVLIAGASLFLGASLFRQRIATTQTAEFKTETWTIKLERVGPGIFFALFGAAVLIIGILTQANISGPTAAAQSNETAAAVSYLGPDAQQVLSDRILALNTLLSFFHHDQPERTLPAHIEKVVGAQKIYTDMRNEAAVALFGRKFRIWTKYSEQQPVDASEIPLTDTEFPGEPNVRQVYEEVDKVMSQTWPRRN
jgi:hypothetical protein